jgi:hypothetical protein
MPSIGTGEDKMVTRILAWLAARDEVSWMKFIVACFLIMALLGL